MITPRPTTQRPHLFYFSDNTDHAPFTGNRTLLFLLGPEGQEVLLVTIPEFSSTQTACLVNLRTLECEPIRFAAFSAEDDEESEMNISH